MKFLMLVCRDESIDFTPQDRQSIGPEVQAWVSEMEERGVRLQGEVLAPVDATTTVSVRGGETRVDRGPRMEMDAPPSGFNLLDCADVDEAIEVSAKHPIARFGAIELRPFAEG
ncbi:MAG: hypothetical protein JO363_02180 [Solirubrobacterales bacterium]|nr:hypothetical protein [Solirubrobacterales bacterium]